MSRLTDDSLIPFGRYKGIPMADVPADYLLKLREQVFKRFYVPKSLTLVLNYIEENFEVLLQEAESMMVVFLPGNELEQYFQEDFDCSIDVDLDVLYNE